MKRSTAAMGFLLSTVVAPGIIEASPGPLVSLPSGTVVGSAYEGGEVFYNLPFAQPPLGALRWRPPEPVRPHDGIRDSREPGSACMQSDQGWNAGDAARGSEDCLYLNVWRPHGKTSAPVMVWFHGGAFMGGAGNTPLYDGQALTEAGVLLVTVNYRLGVFGYLAHPELSQESPRGISGNYGLLDQIEALRWVRGNIEAFGGDSRNVTIFGQSAGAVSVGALLAAPEAKGLFNKAILQSGAPYGAVLGRLPRLLEAQEANKSFGAIAQLRRLSAKDVTTRWDAYVGSSKGEGLRLSPLVDGAVLPKLPAAVLAESSLHEIAIIVGSNSREFPSALDDGEVWQEALEEFGPRAPAVLRSYAVKVDSVQRGSVADQLMTDIMFGCAARRLATVAPRAWLYEFARPSPGEAMVRHSSELPYVFGNANKDGGVLSHRPFDPGEQALSRTIITYWTNFARTGNPNGPALPEWPSYSHESASAIRLADVVATTHLGSTVCEVQGEGVPHGVRRLRGQPEPHRDQGAKLAPINVISPRSATSVAE